MLAYWIGLVRKNVLYFAKICLMTFWYFWLLVSKDSLDNDKRAKDVADGMGPSK